MTLLRAERSSSVELLTATEPGRRNRRTIDSVLLFGAAVVLGLSAVIASAAPEHDQDVARALEIVLGWADALWKTAFFLARTGSAGGSIRQRAGWVGRVGAGRRAATGATVRLPLVRP